MTSGGHDRTVKAVRGERREAGKGEALAVEWGTAVGAQYVSVSAETWPRLPKLKQIFKDSKLFFFLRTLEKLFRFAAKLFVRLSFKYR